MKSIFKAMALSLGMAAVLSFTSCSNGSSGNDDVIQNSNSNAIVENQSITFTGNLSELISAAEFSEIENISALTIITKNYTAAGDDSWWISIASDTNWSNEISISTEGTWTAANNGWTYSLTGDTLTAYLKNGLFIAGPDGDSTDIYIYYVEAEADQTVVTTETTETDDAETTEASKILFNKDVSGNSETELLSETALDSYTEGTITVSGEWVSGSSTPGICIDGVWNTNLWNDTTNSNSQSFSVIEIKGKSLGINMYSDDTTYTITVTYSAE